MLPLIGIKEAASWTTSRDGKAASDSRSKAEARQRRDAKGTNQRTIGADMGTQASAGPAGDLRALSDPQLITHWADVRARLALTRADEPEHAGIKRLHDDALTEYRRRIDGGLAVTDVGD